MAITMERTLTGKYVTVTAQREYDVCFNNDYGGTVSVKPGTTMTVLITKQWHDYETGWRFIGQVLDKADRERLVKAGTTGPKKKPGYCPDRVYFSNREIKETR